MTAKTEETTRQIVATVREFVQRKVIPAAAEHDHEDSYPDELVDQMADMGLAHTVVWGSDYPHYDCTYPGALAELDATFDRIGRNDLRSEVIYTNARRFMGLK